MKNFKYNKDEISKYMDEFKSIGIKKAEMKGFYDDLDKILNLVTALSDNDIVFYLSYCFSDAPYMGWNSDSLKNMRNINKQLNQNLMNIIALLLVSTGRNISFLDESDDK